MTRDFQEALDGISEIRSRIALSTDFKGYGAATVAASGLFAWAAAGLQGLVIVDPLERFPAFLLLWTGAAILSVCLVGIEMAWRARRRHLRLTPDLIRAAWSQLLPAGLAGALLTIILLPAAPEIRALIPALWQILFSLGLFASARFLSGRAQGAALWYLGAGLVNLGLAVAGAPLSPWTMGIPFGVGQLLLAAALRGSR